MPFADDFYDKDNKDIVTMLCDEAQLPNVEDSLVKDLFHIHTPEYTQMSVWDLCWIVT